MVTGTFESLTCWRVTSAKSPTRASMEDAVLYRGLAAVGGDGLAEEGGERVRCRWRGTPRARRMDVPAEREWLHFQRTSS